jgi:hypothetical protein
MAWQVQRTLKPTRIICYAEPKFWLETFSCFSHFQSCFHVVKSAIYITCFVILWFFLDECHQDFQGICLSQVWFLSIWNESTAILLWWKWMQSFFPSTTHFFPSSLKLGPIELDLIHQHLPNSSSCIICLIVNKAQSQ